MKRPLTALILFTMAIVGFLAITAHSQGQPQNGERGFNPGNSYAVSDIETIGLFSGNLMFNVPLGSLPAGRGGMTGGIALNYNSKLWDTFVTDVIRFTTTHDKTDLVASPEGGWRYNYKYYLKLDYRNLGSETAACTQDIEDSFTIIKVQLVSPDGSQRTMLPGNTGTIGTDEFSNVYPDGRLLCDPGAVTSGQIVTFYSKDNTFLRLEVLTDSDTTWENNTWTLYMADGSKVEYNPNSSTRQTTTDRNGNYIQIIENATDSNYSNHKTTYLKDQFDRKVVIEYEAATDEDRIHSNGFEGETITTRVTWKDIIVNKTYFACEMAPAPLDPDAFEDYTLNESFRVVDKIYLPTQVDGDLFYEFGYNADGTTSADTGWGEVNQVTMPSGAIAEYEYYYDNVSGTINASDVLLNRPIEKKLTYDLEYDGSSSNMTDTWVYTPTATNNILSGLTSVTVTGPDGSSTTEHYEQDITKKGEVYRSVGPDGSVSEKLYTNNSPTSFSGTNPNRFVQYEFVSIADSGGTPVKTAIKEYSQDKNGNTTEVSEYDFVAYSSIPRDGNGRITGLPSGISSYLKRVTKTEFYNPVPDSASTTYNDADSYHLASSDRLLRLQSSAEVQDGSATPKSRTEFTYDYMNYDSSNTKAGNLTSTKVWDSFKGGSSQSYSNPLTGTNSHSTSATYNSYGMPLTSTDANGNVTSITYGNVTCPGGTVTDLYPTQTVTAYGTGVARTSSAVYDCYTGLVTTATDVDNNVSVVTEYDDLGRPVKVRNAAGTALESWVRTEYDDVNRRVVVRADLEAVGDGKKVAVQHFDQLGRVRLSRTLEDAAAEDPANEQHGIKVETRYKTVSGYTYQLTSNPFRAATSSAASGEATMGWTLSTAWSDGRRSEVETFTGSGLPTVFGGSNTNSTGIVRTDVDAERTLVTDQAGKRRISKTNALGQLKEVWEILAASETGSESVSFPNTSIAHGFKTTYSYDTLNNLTTVNQGSQTRTFTYSSLSRLLSAANPESGTISYEYDPNGNLTRKTDARGVQTDYVYDALNRVTNRNYSTPGGAPANYAATPNVTYFYDNLTNAKGKLIKVSSSVSTTEYTGFDILGRVTAHKQTTDGQQYTTGYVYNLSGALVEQTYPSGRVVKNTLDVDGRLSQVQSAKSGQTLRNYANGFNYNAAGAVTSMRLGNGLWETTQFNSRLQPTQIGLGQGSATPNKLKLDYSYGTTQNNGNVLSQTITVPGVTHPFVQAYTYDELNRLKSATETQNSAQTWKQTFTFDRYGNRNFDEANTTTLLKNCGTSPNYTVCSADVPIVNPSVNTANNKLNGTTYDAAGNVITDAEGRQFTYDAENKQVEVENGSSQLVGQYYFDGDGKRVKKVVPNGETTIFVYDAIGRLIGEYSTEVQPTQDAKTQYLTADHLGTPRINTNGVGSVVSRSDYMPYGEEITTGRSSGQGYVVDDVRQGFTGYENDDETGLEYAQARMYANGHGRFSGADPYNIVLESKAEADPQKARAKLLSYLVKTQQWNRYAYVINNPLAYVDPSGEVLELTGTDEEKEAAYKRIEELCGEKCKGRLYREITRDGRTLVKYFDNKGGLAGNAGQIGKVLEEIIDSSTLVEFQVTKKSVVATADGTTENLNLRGGGVTSVFSDKIQIFMSSTAGADFSFHAIRKDFKAADGTVLTGENSVSDAHEIGHAWGAIKDKFMERYNKLSWYQSASNLYKENDSRSLQVENWQRERLGLKYRNKH